MSLPESNSFSRKQQPFIEPHLEANSLEADSVDEVITPTDASGAVVPTNDIWARTEDSNDQPSQADLALKASERRLRFLVEGTRDYAMFLMDADRRIFHWNAGAEQLFGWSREEALGQLGDIIFTPEDRAEGAPEKEAGQALEQGSAPDIRWHIRHDGSRFWSDGVITSLRDDGELLGFTKILRDATREKQADEALGHTHLELQRAHDGLEQRVQDRTAALRQEIAQRRLLEQERLRLLQSVVTAQEEERRRISRELHDQLGQQLTGLLLGLKALTELPGLKQDSPHEKQIATLQHLTNDMMQQIHRLAWELRPASLDTFGLETTLRQFLEEWSKQNHIQADFIVYGLSSEKRLPAEMETALYRVVQEALTNVQRHAGAKNVSVLIDRQDEQVTIVLEDDGDGFAVEQNEDGTPRPVGNRLGLLGMQERLELVGGKLTIESEPGSGTTVFARVPLSPNQDDRQREQSQQ